MTAGRPRIPLADKIARLTGEEQNRQPPLPWEWQNPFDPKEQKEAHWAWDFVVTDCLHRQCLANGDRNLVYEYCVMYRRAMLAAEEWSGAIVSIDDNGVARGHPALKAEEASWDRCRKIGALLGLDPISRNKPLRVGAAELGIADGTSPQTIDLMAFARDRKKPPPWEREATVKPAAE